MRRVVAFIALACVIALLGCQGKPRRIMRPADIQYYDLPPSDAAWTNQPPEYPRTEGLTAPAKGKDYKNMGGMGTGGGAPGGIGSSMPGGAGQGNY